MQLPACGLGNSLRTAQALGPCNHVGDPEEDLNSWFRGGTAPAIAVTCRVNLWMEGISLCLSSLYIWKFAIQNKLNLFIKFKMNSLSSS